MLFGQWSGKVSGDNNGFIIMNIDKLQEDKMGSISVVPPANVNEFAAIARIKFTKVQKDNVEGILDQFLGFDKGNIIVPQNTDKYKLSSVGKLLNGRIVSDNNGRDYLKASWETNLNFKGEVELQKVTPPKPNEVQRIISWGEFTKTISDCEKYKYGMFFRGQNNSSYPLRTRFHKAGCWDLYRHYNETINEVFDYMGVLNNTRYSVQNDVDFGSALLLAQHHGYPTPLLDWTLSPYIAAYFAFREVSEDQCKSVRVFAFHNERWLKEQPQYTIGGFISPGIILKPLNIPLAGNKRAVAQSARSIFSNVENIENVLKWTEFNKPDNAAMPNPYLDYFDIDISERLKVLHDLKLMNIGELSLFPDLDTACKQLGQKYFGQYFNKPFNH